MLGQAVVSALLRRGHTIRALVRPSAAVENLSWSSQSVDVFRADLRDHEDLLRPAFKDIDTVVHLAASIADSEQPETSSTVLGTETLLKAMEQSETRDIVLASSYSVYDWHACDGVITEESPVEALPADRDGYAIAKILQERLVRTTCDAKKWRYTILRPGFIWGSPDAPLAGVGQKFGPVMLVIAPGSALPLTHKSNCADAFADVLEKRDASSGRVFNVVDGHDLSAWRYTGLVRTYTPASFLRIPLPYWAGLQIARLAKFASSLVFGDRKVLPSILVPQRYTARFRPIRTSTALTSTLGWQPPHSLEDCISLTFGSERERS